MIKFENVVTPSAEEWLITIRGMRNPLVSWDKMDSRFLYGDAVTSTISLGKNDLDLMKRLCNAGTEHRKFMRMLMVYVDITAPLYFEKQLDTYKVGTVCNSESTMHCIHKKEFVLSMFSFDIKNIKYQQIVNKLIEQLNELRQEYLETKDMDTWRMLIQLLPSSFNQRRTMCFNYETLRTIYRQRKGHKLKEWDDFCKWIETLPYAKELIIGE